MALALRIERNLSKSQILEHYLNRVDFGPNLRGVAAAAHGYFGKPVAALSLAESALLAGLPQNPSKGDYFRHRERALRRQQRVLLDLGRVFQYPEALLTSARKENLRLEAHPRNFGAPHFVSALAQGAFSTIQPGLDAQAFVDATSVTTTLDTRVQKISETAIAKTLAELRSYQVSAASVIVIDNQTGDILAYVGSPNFFDQERAGQVDGIRAKRQPGSTLKPFVYAAAFEELGYTAATVLPDVELRLETPFGKYVPRNFDDRYRGPVRLREALGNSLNVPAVHTAANLGVARLLRYLHRLGLSSLDQSPDYYGPAIALGDGEVTLLELTRAYVVLARGGTGIGLRAVSSIERPSTASQQFKPAEPERILPQSVASVLTDILKDSEARQAAFGRKSVLQFEYEVAAKTGTSKGYRDNWVVGYTAAYTVGVWVGNFDGKPMQGVSGITGAGPLFHNVMNAIQEASSPKALPLSKWDPSEVLKESFQLKSVEICPLSGHLRGPFCTQGIREYVPVDAELPTCEWHRELPLDRRNHLLAGEGCSREEVEPKVFEVFPEPFREWANQQGRALPPHAYSPYCSEPTSTANRELALEHTADKPVILYPKSGSQFVFDPEQSPLNQQVKFEVITLHDARRLTLLIDGSPTAHYPKGAPVFWSLQAGRHLVAIKDDQGRQSSAVEIEVRAIEKP
jgi:penicillin-binding protein 1C